MKAPLTDLLALKIKLRREELCLSQAALAKRSGIAPQTLSSFETGARIHSIKVVQLAAIVSALGMTLPEFLEWRPEELEPRPKVTRASLRQRLDYYRAPQSTLGAAWESLL